MSRVRPEFTQIRTECMPSRRDLAFPKPRFFLSFSETEKMRLKVFKTMLLFFLLAHAMITVVRRLYYNGRS